MLITKLNGDSCIKISYRAEIFGNYNNNGKICKTVKKPPKCLQKFIVLLFLNGKRLEKLQRRNCTLEFSTLQAEHLLL